MNIKVLRVIIASAASCVILASAALGFTGVLSQKSSNKDYASWMSKINDNTSLRNINMPGSHDSTALYSIGDLAGQCQSLSLEDQLNLGVRFLDIRLKLNKNELKAVHGIVDERLSMTSISNTLETFLKDHPSEMIIMSVKEEADPSNSNISFEESLKSYLNKDVYYTSSTFPKNLGKARGKVVLLSRYENPTIGIPAYDGWKDSTSFTLPNDIYVQDEYKIASKEQKQNAILSCFNEKGHKLKINFLSAYRTNGFPPSYAPSAANDINPWIDNEIYKYADRGIVLYDFVTESNMQAFFKGVL